MIGMVDYEYIRKQHFVEGWSIKELVARTGHCRATIRKVIRMDVVAPPRYKRSRARRCHVLEPYLGLIEHWLDEDRGAPAKQRHTARRIYHRLVNEYGFVGSEASVRRRVRQLKGKVNEASMPLSADWGEQAQVDWGKAKAVLGGDLTEVCIFVVRMRRSGIIFAWASRTDDIAAFLEGHVRAFEWLGGVPHTCVYDNLKTAVVKILAGPVRVEHERFSALRAHYLFDSEFCARAKGNEKGSVENGVGYVRRNTMVPMPDLSTIEDLNDILLDWCEAQRNRLAEEWLLEAAELRRLPSYQFNASTQSRAIVNLLSLVTVARNQYSVPSQYVGLTVSVELSATLVEIYSTDKPIAVHFRAFSRNTAQLQLKHYLDVLERKPRSAKNATVVRELPAIFQVVRKRLCDSAPDGYRELCRILLLHRRYSVRQLGTALERVCDIGQVTAEAVEHVLIAVSQPAIPRAEVPEALQAYVTIQHSPDKYNSLTGAA